MSFRSVDLIVSCTLGDAVFEGKDGPGVEMTVQASMKPGEWSDEWTVTLKPWEALASSGAKHARLGELMFHPNGARQTLFAAIKEAKRTVSWLRIVIELNKPKSADNDDRWKWLVSAPWESVYVPLDGRPVALALLNEPRVSIVRAIPQHHTNSHRLGPGTSRKYLHVDATDAYTESTAGPLDPRRFDAENGEAASLDHLKALVEAHSTDLGVLHVTAHGEPGWILLPEQRISAQAFATTVKQAKFALLVLSICSSADQDRDGVIEYLEWLALPAFVGMQQPISVFDNHVFVMAFFPLLALGASLDEAMAAGREALLRSGPERGPQPWWIPVLYVNLETRAVPTLWEAAAASELESIALPDNVLLAKARRTRSGHVLLLHDGIQGPYWAEPSGLVDSRTMRMSPGAELAGTIVNGELIINRLGYGGDFYPFDPASLSGAGLPSDARLLAIAAEGTERAACLISHDSGTELVRVFPDGVVESRERFDVGPSFAGVLRGGKALLVTGTADGTHTTAAFPQLTDVWAIGAAFTGDVLRVLAIGLDGSRRAAVHVNGTHVIHPPIGTNAVGLVHEVGQDRPPSALVLVVNGQATYEDLPNLENWSSESWR